MGMKDDLLLRSLTASESLFTEKYFFVFGLVTKGLSGLSAVLLTRFSNPDRLPLLPVPEKLTVRFVWWVISYSMLWQLRVFLTLGTDGFLNPNELLTLTAD